MILWLNNKSSSELITQKVQKSSWFLTNTPSLPECSRFLVVLTPLQRCQEKTSLLFVIFCVYCWDDFMTAVKCTVPNCTCHLKCWLEGSIPNGLSFDWAWCTCDGAERAINPFAYRERHCPTKSNLVWQLVLWNLPKLAIPSDQTSGKGW